MAQNREKKRLVLLRDGLQAGFLYSDQATSKRYFGFKTDERGIVWVRECTSKEKSWLGKIVFEDKKVKGTEALSGDGRKVSLFTYH